MKSNISLEQPAYYAVIPASVRYDRELKPGARLLYGEITALVQAEGYCWASNSYFARLYDVQPNTISLWVRQLARRGYIRCAREESRESEHFGARKIYLSCALPRMENGEDPSLKMVRPIIKNDEGAHQKSLDPLIKNGEQNNINYTIPPIVPQGTTGSDGDFDRFWSAYPRKVAKPRARTAWRRQKIRPEELDALLSALEADKQGDQWTRDGGRYIPHPATWLNQRRWEDEDRTPEALASVPAPRWDGEQGVWVYG